MARTELTQERHQLQQERDELREQQRENALQLRMLHIYQKARNANGQILRQCEANDEALKEYLGLPSELLITAISKDSGRFVWTDIPASATDPKILDKDRRTLAQAARANRNFGGSDANLSLCRDTLGAGFTEHLVIEGFRSGKLRLAGPSEEERQQWLEEDADEENLRLLNSDSRTLKEEVRNGYADRRAQAAQAEANRVLDQKREWQTGQFKPLPRTWNGQRLDASFIRAASPQLIRQLREHYGSLQLDLRLRGEN